MNAVEYQRFQTALDEAKIFHAFNQNTFSSLLQGIYAIEKRGRELKNEGDITNGDKLINFTKQWISQFKGHGTQSSPLDDFRNEKMENSLEKIANKTNTVGWLSWGTTVISLLVNLWIVLKKK